MGPVAALARSAGIAITTAAGLDLIDLAEAPRFLDACLREGWVILGVEGFRIEGDRLSPEMTAIADFSGLCSSRESVGEARRFVERMHDSGLKLDFVLVRSPST